METDYSNYEMNKDPFLEAKAQKVINMMKFMITTYQIDIRKVVALSFIELAAFDLR